MRTASKYAVESPPRARRVTSLPCRTRSARSFRRRSLDGAFSAADQTRRLHPPAAREVSIVVKDSRASSFDEVLMLTEIATASSSRVFVTSDSSSRGESDRPKFRNDSRVDRVCSVKRSTASSSSP